MIVLGVAALAGGLMTTGLDERPAVAQSEPANATTAPFAAAPGEAPFFGVNASTMLTRDKVGAGGGAAYDWDAAAATLEDKLDVDVIRAGIYCSDPSIVEEYPEFSPFGCGEPGKPNDVEAVKRIIAEDALTVAPLVQVNWATSRQPGAPAFDESLRGVYYEHFGRHIGRTFAGEVASGAIPYFEVGNEPDHSCIIGNPWGDKPGDFDAACVDRVRTSILGLQSGIRAGVLEAIAAGEAPSGTAPQFAVGASGIRWGITDALWNAVPTAATPNPEPVKWDFTVVHWYYQNGYGDTVADPLDQRFGLDNVHGMDAIDVWNAAANYRDRYGKPLVVTEFGVFPRGQAGASDASRASSFTRLLTGLYNLADEYNIAGLFAFTLSGPEGQGDGGASGDYNLADYDAASSAYVLTPVGEAYRSFMDQPLLLADATAPVVLLSPGIGETITTPTPTFTGTGTPGATVQVRGGTRSYCVGIVTDTGEWSCTSTLEPLGRGDYTGLVRQTKPGEHSTSAPLAYSIVPGR